MILITIDNNKDFLRVRMNRSKFKGFGRKKKGLLSRLFGFGISGRRPLIPNVFPN